MRFFKILSGSSLNDILDKFGELSEVESHNMLTSLFESYHSSRVGIHSYLNKNRVRGYYETGELNGRKTGLSNVKNWFFLSIRETKKGPVVRGVILGDIYLTCAIHLAGLGLLIEFLNHPNVAQLFYFALAALLGGFILYKGYKTQRKLYDTIVSFIDVR